MKLYRIYYVLDEDKSPLPEPLLYAITDDKEKVKLLNKLIEEYDEREKRLMNENKQLKLNIKEEGTTAAPILRDEGILHSCSSISNNKISEPSKRIPMANKESKYVTPIVFKKIKSKKISRKNGWISTAA